MNRAVAALLGGLVALSFVSTASAHGDLQGSDPSDGERVGRVPPQVTLTLTEPPGPGSSMKVVDGCDRNVATRVTRSGADLVAVVRQAQPGDWRATFKGVSSVDGHVTRGTVRFTVSGKRRCNNKNGREESPQIGGGEDTQVASEAEDDGGGLPVVPIAIGSLLVIGIALVLRRLSTG